jgi:hypothetical protein
MKLVSLIKTCPNEAHVNINTGKDLSDAFRVQLSSKYAIRKAQENKEKLESNGHISFLSMLTVLIYLMKT